MKKNLAFCLALGTGMAILYFVTFLLWTTLAFTPDVQLSAGYSGRDRWEFLLNCISDSDYLREAGKMLPGLVLAFCVTAFLGSRVGSHTNRDEDSQHGVRR